MFKILTVESCKVGEFCRIAECMISETKDFVRVSSPGFRIHSGCCALDEA